MQCAASKMRAADVTCLFLAVAAVVIATGDNLSDDYVDCVGGTQCSVGTDICCGGDPRVPNSGTPQCCPNDACNICGCGADGGSLVRHYSAVRHRLCTIHVASTTVPCCFRAVCRPTTAWYPPHRGDTWSLLAVLLPPCCVALRCRSAVSPPTHTHSCNVHTTVRTAVVWYRELAPVLVDGGVRWCLCPVCDPPRVLLAASRPSASPHAPTRATLPIPAPYPHHQQSINEFATCVSRNVWASCVCVCPPPLRGVPQNICGTALFPPGVVCCPNDGADCCGFDTPNPTCCDGMCVLCGTDAAHPDSCVTALQTPTQVYESGQCATPCPGNASYVADGAGGVHCVCNVGVTGAGCNTSAPFPWTYHQVNAVDETCKVRMDTHRTHPHTHTHPHTPTHIPR